MHIVGRRSSVGARRLTRARRLRATPAPARPQAAEPADRRGCARDHHRARELRGPDACLPRPERPADEPTPKPPGIFSEVGGWIVYGNEDGIWAVDPARPGDPNSQIQLSTETGTPLAWSSDGSKLLILRRNTAGPDAVATSSSSTRTAPRHTWPRARGGHAGEVHGDRGGSFSPDGSQVIYASKVVHLRGRRAWRHAAGAPNRQPPLVRYPGVRVQALAYNPTYSPDGTQIAYFDGVGDSETVTNFG